VQEISQDVLVETSFRSGVNTGAILTSEGYILIDPPAFPDDARRWQAILHEHSEDSPVRAVILTDAHRDRILGASWYKPMLLISHTNTRASLSSLPGSYLNTLVNMLTTDSVEQAKFSSARILIPNITFSDRIRLHFGDTTLLLSYHPGPTDGTIWIYSPQNRILFSGDSVIVGMPPFLNSMHSKEWLDALNIIRHRMTLKQIVPGRGDLTHKESTVPISHYIRLARRRVRSLYKARRPPSETLMLVHELLALFPPPLESQLEGFQQRVRTGLQSIYNEFRQQDTDGGYYGMLDSRDEDEDDF
jgi:glyoxylase-like metal-dependent hydrolase (beta-lactamase superfamily II)